MGEIIVGGGDAIDEVLEDDGEVLDELLGFIGEGEGFVILGGEVQVVEDFGDVFFFGCGFGLGDVGGGLEAILVL